MRETGVAVVVDDIVGNLARVAEQEPREQRAALCRQRRRSARHHDPHAVGGRREHTRRRRERFDVGLVEQRGRVAPLRPRAGEVVGPGAEPAAQHHTVTRFQDAQPGDVFRRGAD